MSLNKKQTITTHILIITTIFLALIACNEKVEKALDECDVELNQCLSLQNEHVKIQFNTKYILVENNYRMKVFSDEEIDTISLTGVNMNMGRLPILLNNKIIGLEGVEYTGDFILGMCSEPEMTWQIEIKTINNKLYYLSFNSYWQLPK